MASYAVTTTTTFSILVYLLPCLQKNCLQQKFCYSLEYGQFFIRISNETVKREIQYQVPYLFIFVIYITIFFVSRQIENIASIGLLLVLAKVTIYVFHFDNIE